KQVDQQVGTTLYINAGAILVEKATSNSGIIQWTDYLFAGNEMIGAYFERFGPNGNTTFTRYFHKDHLGSTAALTVESGLVTGAGFERDAYDAWGKRRFPHGTDDTGNTLTSQTTRGYTGQEHLQDVQLIHMNGRVYDPQIGKFTSADPLIQDPFNSQNLNR